MLYVLSLRKGVAHMFIHLYGFQMHYILQRKLPISSLLRKQKMYHARPVNDTQRFELIKTYQVYAQSRTCCKNNKNKCHSR